MHLSFNTFLQDGKYRILRFIGSGGFGTTYEAEHVLLGERVAIKEFFVKDYCNRDVSTGLITVGTHSKISLVDKLKRKFLDEARMLYKMQHPGIVRVFDIFEENGTAYFVMNFIDGPSLNDLVTKEGRLSEERAMCYIRQIAEALKCVHEHGCLHLDIKPGNVMIDKSDNAILIDFGASKQYDEVDGENTSTLLGMTPGYAPLEQMGNDVVKFTPATDIYALGATLYKLLTGKTPLSANLLASGETLDEFPEDVSTNVREVVTKSMEINKNRRPQNIVEFLGYLDRNDSMSTSNIDAEDTILLNNEPSHIEKPKAQNLGSESNHSNKSKIILIIVAIVLCLGAYMFYNALTPYLNMKNDLVNYTSSIIEGDRLLGTGNYSEALMRYNHAKCLEDIYSYTKYNHYFSENATKKIGNVDKVKYNGYQYVDLGLPSGVKWATCNIGANSPEDAGNYYAWGELQPKSTYNKSNSLTYGKLLEDISSNLRHDAARLNWEGVWRLPTAIEFMELIELCSCTWTTQGGQKGCKFTGPNGNSIFLPLAGHITEDGLSSFGNNGYYWTSTPYPDEGWNGNNYSYDAKLFSDRKDLLVYFGSRIFGNPIRPVSD